LYPDHRGDDGKAPSSNGCCKGVFDNDRCPLLCLGCLGFGFQSEQWLLNPCWLMLSLEIILLLPNILWIYIYIYINNPIGEALLTNITERWRDFEHCSVANFHGVVEGNCFIKPDTPILFYRKIHGFRLIFSLNSICVYINLY
jgi:hypothetical protein